MHAFDDLGGPGLLASGAFYFGGIASMLVWTGLLAIFA